jgi:hypothetical protein
MGDQQVVPIWALSSGGSDDDFLQRLYDGEQELSRDRLDRLRAGLVALSDDPPVVLERYAVSPQEVPGTGRLVAAGSPLAKSLAEIVGSTRQAAPAEVAAGTTEVLYKMVVPDKLAGQLAAGTARQMSAKGDGVYSAIRGSKSIVGNARFVPVAAGAGGGAATGGAAVAAGAGVGAAVLAAAPVVLLLAATAGSIYAEQERRAALGRVEDILHQLQTDELDEERDELNGAVPAITKATALLADEGRLGHSLGLDAAVNRIDTAVSRVERRVSDWERALAGFAGTATPDRLIKAFPGLGAPGGEFEAKLRMAVFAIAMKRRVAILQAAEHTRNDSNLSLSRFNRELAKDTADLAALEGRIVTLLGSLAGLSIEAPKKRVDRPYRPSEVRELLRWTPYLRTFADRELPAAGHQGDLELFFVAQDDGSIRVLEPASA